MTACKDGTEGGLDSFLPCTKEQMSADPSLIDDPNYFESHLMIVHPVRCFHSLGFPWRKNNKPTVY